MRFAFSMSFVVSCTVVETSGRSWKHINTIAIARNGSATMSTTRARNRTFKLEFPIRFPRTGDRSRPSRRTSKHERSHREQCRTARLRDGPPDLAFPLADDSRLLARPAGHRGALRALGLGPRGVRLLLHASR